MNVMPVPSDRPARLTALRRRIERIERGRLGAGSAGETRPAAGLSAGFNPGGVDPFLMGDGQAVPALHELVADSYGSQPAVRDFALALIARLLHRQAENRGMVLWCQRQRDALEFGRPYGPGLRSLGFPPDRLLMVTGRHDADCLWAMEQGLASRSLAAVIGAVDRAGLTASRRLSLAAAAHGTWCLLLPLQHGREPSAARTRWCIAAAPSIPDVLDEQGLGRPRWQLTLERSPGGRTGDWTVEWDHAAHHFHLAPLLVNQPVAGRTRPNQVGGRGGRNKKATDIIPFDRTG